MIQRKYRIVKTSGWTTLVREVNDLLEQEFKDTEGYLFTAAGRWQCLGAPFKDGEDHCQAMVFERDDQNHFWRSTFFSTMVGKPLDS